MRNHSCLLNRDICTEGAQLVKRLILTFATLLTLLMPAAAAAYSPFGTACQAANNGSSACTTNGKNTLTGPHGYIRKASTIVATIAGIAAVIVMIVGGLQYIVANGDPQKLSNARNAIVGAAIGLIIVVAAEGIIIFVLNNLK